MRKKLTQVALAVGLVGALGSMIAVVKENINLKQRVTGLERDKTQFQTLLLGAVPTNAVDLSKFVRIRARPYPDTDSLPLRKNEVDDCNKCRVVAASADSSRITALNGSNLSLLSSLREASGSRKAPYTLIVLFSTGDCPMCLRESSIWDELDKHAPERLSVVGIVDQTSSIEAEQFASGAHISFPILLDTASQLRKALNISYTPAKILINMNGLVLFADHPNQTDEQQAVFRQRVIALIEGN